MLRVTYRRYILIIALVVAPMLVGSQCAFFFSSGGSSDSDTTDEKKGLVVVVNTGSFGDAPVEGMNYASGSLSGITGKKGEFEYEIGKTVQFSIGDLSLGRAVQGKSIITPLDLIENGTSETAAVINIARLLQSLDSKPGNGRITIPHTVREETVRTNKGLFSAIEFMDFHDDSAFANAASQLVSVLTRDYPHTAVLVDADNARKQLTSATGESSKQANDSAL